MTEEKQGIVYLPVYGKDGVIAYISASKQSLIEHAKIMWEVYGDD